MAGHEMGELILLKARIADLIEAYNSLEIERDGLKHENSNLNSELNNRGQEIDDLNVDFNRVKLSGAILGDGEKPQEAKKRINDLVREIDNCIALLNNI